VPEVEQVRGRGVGASSSSIRTEGALGTAVESTRTSGMSDAINRWTASSGPGRPTTRSPSAVARSSARDSEPRSGEMKWSSYPAASATSATPAANVAKNGLWKVVASACGVTTPIDIVRRRASIRATGCGR
jgi:hypothetical protein